ncbi:MAG: hypothetical protein NC924_05575 [Candidatus Omnitrophica bacterium]|nr:hypothetical protein [Candidatus Omnitrophota bacterium]
MESNASILHTTQNVYLDFSGQNCNGFYLRANRCQSVVIKNLKIKVKTDSTATYGILAEYCTALIFSAYNYIVGTSSAYGYGMMFSYGSVGYALKNYVSTVWAGVGGYLNSQITSEGNDDTGTQPIYGLIVYNGAVIAKNSTQPAGSTANESENTGGDIR